MHDAAPNQYAVMLLGTSRVQANGFSLPFPLDAIGLPGCQLYTSAQWSAPVLTGSVGNAAGYGALDLQCTLGLGPAAMPVYAQWLCFTSGLQPGGASDAVSLSIR